MIWICFNSPYAIFILAVDEHQNRRPHRCSNTACGRDFLPVHTDTVIHTASCAIGYWVSFLGVDWKGRDVDLLPPSARRV